MAASRLKRRLGIGRKKRQERATSALLVALGAVAGVALGMVIADRTGGLDGLLGRVRGNAGKGGKGKGQGTFGNPAGWGRDERRSEAFDGLSDDDSELSPESIAHMHVRERAEGQELKGPAPRGRGWRGGVTSRPLPVDTAARSSSDDVRALPLRHVPDEAALEARVLEAFINDPVLRERAIDICASGTGTIELTGWVQAGSEIGHAMTLARGVPDVTAVIDRLAVRGAEPARDHSGYRYAGPPPGGEGTAIRAD
ncbi:MAG TPA: BON domain-containing protein [Gemmatimonas sp.]|nr:BON domain-containing protein [Gemmatimonas sp.]